MIVFDQIEQGSEEWLNVRKGRATASAMDKIVTATGKLSAQRLKYMRQLTRERVVDDPLEWTGNRYTDWGNETEAEAREQFTRITGHPVKQVGFVVRSDEAPLGCSPDGLIADEAGQYIAGLELKCPQVDTHVNYLMEGKLPDEYRMQVHGSMAVTGLKTWWFMSYFPGLNPLIVEVSLDSFTEMVNKQLDAFVIEYAEERKRVLGKILPKPEATIMEPDEEDLNEVSAGVSAPQEEECIL